MCQDPRTRTSHVLRTHQQHPSKGRGVGNANDVRTRPLAFGPPMAFSSSRQGNNLLEVAGRKKPLHARPRLHVRSRSLQISTYQPTKGVGLLYVVHWNQSRTYYSRTPSHQCKQTLMTLSSSSHSSHTHLNASLKRTLGIPFSHTQRKTRPRPKIVIHPKSSPS